MCRYSKSTVQKLTDQILNNIAKNRSASRFVTAGLSTENAVTAASLDTTGFVTAAKNNVFAVTA
jgi:hypothetical protein